VRALLLAALLLPSPPAMAGEGGRLSPPLSVEGARAALAQAGVREGVEFALGPFRYRVVSTVVGDRGRNRFHVEVVLEPLYQKQD